MKKAYLLSIVFLGVLYGCYQTGKNYALLDKYPETYPDYKNICIPYNIAPLNFMVKGDFGKISVDLSSKSDKVQVSGSHKISIPLKKFKELLLKNKGDTIWVTVSVRSKKNWLTYKSFYWKVVAEPVDPFLTYRLIEPGYEVWKNIIISQRDITSFKETSIADNNLTEGSCMNCHIGSKQNPERSFFHIRGPKGMTVIANGKNLRKLNTKPEGAYSNMIYGNWHPSGRFIAFSNNVVLPAIHSFRDKRAFVYDTISDVVVLDIEKNEILTTLLLSDKNKFETFPEFSSDGNKLFFCTANKVKLPREYAKLQYSLCSIDFNSTTRTFGSQIDTLFNGPVNGKSVSEPKSSPDGSYILFTCFRYGTFPIWHSDARLYSYNLRTGQIDTLPYLNNNEKYSNSYHSWSSNSRWVVFASKRDDGLYGKPYFAYIDNAGNYCKPFVLPQKDPEFYDFTYKSYNIPELFKKPRLFSSINIEALFKDTAPLEQVHYKQ